MTEEAKSIIMTKCSIWIDPALKQELRIISAQLGTNMSQYIRDAVLEKYTLDKENLANIR